MSNQPKWQACSHDNDILEMKGKLGLRRRIVNGQKFPGFIEEVFKQEYCLKCSVFDGWVQCKVSTILLSNILPILLTKTIFLFSKAFE